MTDQLLFALIGSALSIASVGSLVISLSKNGKAEALRQDKAGDEDSSGRHKALAKG